MTGDQILSSFLQPLYEKKIRKKKVGVRKQFFLSTEEVRIFVVNQG